MYLLRYMNGIFTIPTSHFKIVWPRISGKIGEIPKNAIGINIRLSISKAGIELNTLRAHRCLPLVYSLNQEYI